MSKLFNKVALSLMASGLALSLTACTLKVDNNAVPVVIASPDEVKDCAFISDLEVPPRYVIENARFNLKEAAYKVGATHVVETYAYARLINRLGTDMGIALRGRAYKCPVNVGSTSDNEEAKAKLKGDLPVLSVNDDDPFLIPRYQHRY